jgi:DNA-binding winged helix-turn-helix (wHTH) protein
MNPRVLEILAERQALHARLAALDQEEREILTGTVRSEDESPDFSMFKDTTNRLLTEFMNAPDKMLSQEDIRQDVILDDEASENAVWSVIKRAKQELSRCHECHYGIKSIPKKGYQLVISRKLSNTVKNIKKPRKQG